MAIDFAAVFRVLVTLFGITALLSAIVGLVSFFAGGAELLLGVALVSAILSLAFRLPAASCWRTLTGPRLIGRIVDHRRRARIPRRSSPAAHLGPHAADEAELPFRGRWE